MRLLLDSHMMIRLDSDPSLVPAFKLDAISDRANEVFVSAATGWELGIKVRKGKLVLSRSVSEQCRFFGFSELEITMAHGELAASLPLHHKDPFDRMLVAQAIFEGMVLVTADARLGEYPAKVL